MTDNSQICNFNFNLNPIDISEIPRLLKEKANTLGLNTKEIERKWIINADILRYLMKDDKFLLSDYRIITQGYLSIEPEIRIRRDFYPNINITKYFLSYKSSGTLSRDEYEVEINKDDYMHLYGILDTRKNMESKLIYKEYYNYKMEELLGIEFEISNVDNNELTYLEIEFKSEEAANNFKIPDALNEFIIKEVTNDASYKMKNYWKTTRIGIPTL